MKIERKSLLDQTVETLRRGIVHGELQPGARLTEIGLAEEMDSRRSTVRAALLELEKEGLVQRTRYSAWAVSPLTKKIIWEIYTYRGALEGLASRLLAKSLNDKKRVSLSDSYKLLSDAEATGTETIRVEADLRFHRTIVSLSEHELLLQQYEILLHKIEWIYRWSERRSPHRIQLTDWHRPVFDAILAGDPDRAEKAIRALTDASLADDLADLNGLLKQQA